MKLRSKAAFCLFFLLAFWLGSTPALPQADVATATLKGTVTDESNALVPGATVHVKDLARGISRQGKTDEAGVYQFRLLQPGVYELRLEAAGFKAHVVSKVELSVGQIGIYDVQLRVGAVTEEIAVTAVGSLVEVERSHQSNTIQQNQIENLPNIGRAFTSYMFSLPGVSSSESPRAQFPGFTFGSSGFSIGGSNGRNNLITVDGGENEYGSGQLRNVTMSIEAIQEFQVNRNAFAAEFGFTAGTAVNVVTKSGTNDFHGSGYFFYRSQKTSARNFFDTRAIKAFNQQMYPGLTFGGPLARNKVFLFTSYEALKSDAARFRRYRDNPAILGPAAAQAEHLSRLEGAADANTRRIGGLLRARLTTTNFPTTMKLLTDNDGAFNAAIRAPNWSTRIDYQVRDQDSLNVRFTMARAESDQTVISNSLAPSNSTDLTSRDYTTVAAWTHNFRSNLINQARVQLVPNNSATTRSKAPGSTALIVPGIATFGRLFSAPFNTFQDRYQFEDILSWAKGRHFFKIGASHRPVNYRVNNELWFGGEWRFASGVYPLILALPAADQTAFVLFNRSVGVPDNGPAAANFSALQSLNLEIPFLFRQGFNNPEWQDWAHFLGVFAQDSWKITPRFTLDAGVRLDYDREPRPLRAYTNVSPRLGLAWDPFGDQKTVIRAGGGIFYAPVYYQVAYVTNLLNDSGRYINQVFRSPAAVFGAQTPAALWARGAALGKLPFQALSQQDLNSFGVATGQGALGRVIFDASPAYKNNYTIQTSFGLSRQILPDLSLDLAYQLYRGVHLQVSHEVNYRETGAIGPDLGPLLAPIDPTITQMNLYSSIGNSIYHGMTVSLTKRYSRHSQFQFNYTFSKTIDDVTDFNSAFSAYIPTRLNLERGLSAFDIRHNFVASGVFRAPFQAGPDNNWLSRALADITLSPVVFLRSGIPFTVRIGNDVNGDTHADYDRPFLAGRNTGLGENYYSLDLRLSKQFHLRRESGFRVEFIAEAGNLLNHTNFLAINDVVGLDRRFLLGPFNLRGDRSLASTSPLGFTAAADPRRIQFGLKIVF